MLARLLTGPERGRSLTRTRIETALRRGGRQRNITVRAEAIQTALQTEQLAQPPMVAEAFSATVSALVAVLIASVNAVADLERQLAASFGRHPAVELILSQPGLGPVLGARVLAEFGDDPHRYADAKARKNYAGNSPITKASGKSRVVLARYRTNKRLRDALRQQAFSALSTSPGARVYYDAHRAAGAQHDKALRAVATAWSASSTAVSAMPLPTTNTPPGDTATTSRMRPDLTTQRRGISGRVAP